MKRLIQSSLRRTCRRYEYYYERGAPDFVLQLASIENRHFGMAMEYVARDLLQMEKSHTKMYDAKLENQRIEIKSSRVYLPYEDYKWVRLQPHKFDTAFLIALQPSGLQFYTISAKECLRMKVNTLSFHHHRDYITPFKHITTIK
jgi:hypothetical protein